MRTIKDFYKYNKGKFIGEIASPLWSEHFSSGSLDFEIMSKYSKLEVMDYVFDIDPAVLANMIYLKHYNEFSRMYEILKTKYNIIHNYNRHEVAMNTASNMNENEGVNANTTSDTGSTTYKEGSEGSRSGSQSTANITDAQAMETSSGTATDATEGGRNVDEEGSETASNTLHKNETASNTLHKSEDGKTVNSVTNSGTSKTEAQKQSNYSDRMQLNNSAVVTETKDLNLNNNATRIEQTSGRETTAEKDYAYNNASAMPTKEVTNTRTGASDKDDGYYTTRITEKAIQTAVTQKRDNENLVLEKNDNNFIVSGDKRGLREGVINNTETGPLNVATSETQEGTNTATNTANEEGQTTGNATEEGEATSKTKDQINETMHENKNTTNKESNASASNVGNVAAAHDKSNERFSRDSTGSRSGKATGSSISKEKGKGENSGVDYIHSYGNIGVTTTQRMLEQEKEFWEAFNFPNYVINVFLEEIRGEMWGE